MLLEKTLRLNTKDLTEIIQRKYDVEITDMKISRFGIRCEIK